MRRKHLRAKSGHLSEKPKRDGFYKHTPNYITAAATMTAASTSAPVGTFILNCRALSDLCVARKSKAHRYSLYNAFIADTSFPNRIHMRRYTDFDQIASAAAERRMSEVCAMQASKWEFDNATNDDADDAVATGGVFRSIWDQGCIDRARRSSQVSGVCAVRVSRNAV